MSISILAAAFLFVAGQTPAPSTATTPPPAADPEKKVCKTIKETGSRLGGKRECRTQAEWSRIAEETQAKARGNMGR
jgi:hypothetical protein